MTTATLTNIDYALNYALEWGWAVMPLHSIAADGVCTCGDASCKNAGKHPRTKHGLKDATKDADQIKAWWQQWPEANIGIATGPISGIVVVDVDSDKGANHADLIIGSLGHTILSTVRVKTGGGMHYYYKYPSVSVKNSNSKLGSFIDTRGDGGYVVAPPSLHASGWRYDFIGKITTLLDFPQEWIDKLNTQTVSSPPNGNGNHSTANRVNTSNGGIFVPPPNPGLVVPDEINQGNRNHEMTKVAGALRDKGLSEGAIFAALAVENQRICKPPLDDKELHQIARSVSRYKPKQTLNQTADPDDADIDNTLRVFGYKEFREQIFEPKEILAFHIGMGDLAMLSGGTNTGKSTLLRNVLMCAAAGRPFMPFYEGHRPIKTVYFDLETDAEDLQHDTGIMEMVFTPAEMSTLEENLIMVPKGILHGELFQFNTHENFVKELIIQNKIELVVVDNVSAAFDLHDENSGSEVTKKVMKPLGKLAARGHCAVAFAHHFGKQKIVNPDEVGVHAGRGSSSFGNLSRTVFNMFGDVSKGETSTVYCAKRKTNGGQSYHETFKLESDRWFHQTTFVAPPPKTCMEEIVDLLQTRRVKVPAREIVRSLAARHHRATVFRNLQSAVRMKMIETFAGKYWLTGEEEDEDEDS